MEDHWNNASIDELRGLLRGRFQMRGPGAADAGTREGEMPYDLPLELWKAADAARRRDLAEATRDLIAEVPGEGWTTRAAAWLVEFIDLARMVEAVDALEDAAETGRWLKSADDPPRCHMVLLRTLLDLGWKGAPRLWRSLPDEVAARYPELLFRGLLAHDEDEAYRRLPVLIPEAESARRAVDVLSAEVRREGADAIRRKLRAIRSAFTPEAWAELAYWFDVHKWRSLAAEDGEGETGDGDPAITPAHLKALALKEMPKPDRAWQDTHGRVSPIEFVKGARERKLARHDTTELAAPIEADNRAPRRDLEPDYSPFQPSSFDLVESIDR